MPLLVPYIPTDPRKLRLCGTCTFYILASQQKKHTYHDGEFLGTYQHSLRLIKVFYIYKQKKNTLVESLGAYQHSLGLKKVETVAHLYIVHSSLSHLYVYEKSLRTYQHSLRLKKVETVAHILSI